MNVGLNFLRILLTLGVVLDHFWWTSQPELYTGLNKALWQFRTLAVPVFMTMTFFFTAGRFQCGDVPWLKKRFVRLYEPFVFWALIYYVVRMALSKYNAWYAVSFSDLLWQIGLGSSEHLCMQFWFHSDLIILTAVVFLAFRIVRCAKANLYLALSAIAFGFTMQYTPANDALFGWMPFEARYPLGRLNCMLPYVGVGFLFAAAKGNLDGASKGVKVALSLFGLWTAILVTYCNVCPRPHSIPGYAGLNMNLIAWGVMLMFYYIPFDRLPDVCSRLVLSVSKYCMGVYCIHLLLGQVVFDYVFRGTMTSTEYGDLRIFSIAQCLLVWGLSYACCWLISKVPVRFFKRVVE